MEAVYPEGMQRNVLLHLDNIPVSEREAFAKAEAERIGKVIHQRFFHNSELISVLLVDSTDTPP